MTTDPLDFAYFAKGVGAYLADQDNPRPSNFGELEFVSECIRYADALDVELPEDFSGVFVYDVAEEFGVWVAESIGHGEEITKESAAARVAELIAEA